MRRLWYAGARGVEHKAETLTLNTCSASTGDHSQNYRSHHSWCWCVGPLSCRGPPSASPPYLRIDWKTDRPRIQGWHQSVALEERGGAACHTCIASPPREGDTHPIPRRSDPGRERRPVTRTLSPLGAEPPCAARWTRRQRDETSFAVCCIPR